jgi:glutamate dehydrogenase
MGFRVISERTFEIEAEEGAAPTFVHDMELVNGFGQPIDLSDGGALLEEVFLSVWRGETDNDAYAALVQTAGMGAHQIQLLRAYGRYLQQAGIPQSQDFIAAVLNRYPDIARALFQLFEARFDPAMQKEGEVTALHIKAAIKDALDAVAEPRRRHDHAPLPEPYRILVAHQLFFGFIRRSAFAGDQARFAGRFRPAGAAPMA